MKMRTILCLGMTMLLALGHTFAANPKQKRAPRSFSHTAAMKDSSMAAVRPTETLPSANSPEIGPSAAAGDNDPEQARYDVAKARAKQDPEVKTLKAQADQATNEDAARRTSVAYNRTLFRKMRQIDRSLTPRIDLVEAAILRRINE